MQLVKIYAILEQQCTILYCCLDKNYVFIT